MICGINNPKITFTALADFGKTIAKPKNIEPKLKNFIAVAPVLTVLIQTVKNTQTEKSDNTNNIIFITDR